MAIRVLTEEQAEIATRTPTDADELRRKQALRAEADRLYETYGKPLERDHWGDYVAISSDGQTLLARTSFEAPQQATEAFGLGNFIFKVGERVVGRIRCTDD